MDNLELLAQARLAQKNAYAPYSHFRVGAALLTASGKVFLGCNIENAGYAATICAERTALSAAMAAGEREFCKLAVVSDNDPTYPCGVCRQVISELMPKGLLVVQDSDGAARELTVDEILPYAFVLKEE